MVTSLQCLLEVPGWQPWAMRPSQQPCELYQAFTINTPPLQPVSLVLRVSAETALNGDQTINLNEIDVQHCSLAMQKQLSINQSGFW